MGNYLKRLRDLIKTKKEQLDQDKRSVWRSQWRRGALYGLEQAEALYLEEVGEEES